MVSFHAVKRNGRHTLILSELITLDPEISVTSDYMAPQLTFGQKFQRRNPNTVHKIGSRGRPIYLH